METNELNMDLIRFNAKLELARREFFSYCNLKAADFYKEDREYLLDLCNELQLFYEDPEAEVLIINEPPRHGKSRTAGMFVQWVLGENHEEKIMTGSYNETLSTMFSKSVRNDIQEIKSDQLKPVYSDIFPRTMIQRGDGAMNLWSLEGGYNNYLATSPTGTATGFGCSLMIIDDLIKNAAEAMNEEKLQGHWTWFTDTMLSRLEEGGKILMIMTRWHSRDLSGRALEELPKLGFKVRHITKKALQDDGSMLCDEILSHKSYNTKVKAMGLDIASANYQQEPIDIKGRLYSSFKTYDRLPMDDKGNLLFKEIRNYTDTADQGTDFTCSIDYGVTFDNEAYVIDVLYTQDPMEKTEPATAAMMNKDNVNNADIESNNGGRGFSRSVERILKKSFRSSRVIINAFHQSKNKKARILSNATWAMEHVYFPKNWKDKFPEYYDAMNKYQKEGKNLHDDAPDATTGIAEKIGQGSTFDFD
jgi:predicted phage terminase large subunit-like protein